MGKLTGSAMSEVEDDKVLGQKSVRAITVSMVMVLVIRFFIRAIRFIRVVNRVIRVICQTVATDFGCA